MAAASASIVWIFMYSLVVGFVICNLLSTPCNANEETINALIDVKKKLRDPQNVLKTWDASWRATLVDPCTWNHITCDINQRVTRVDLQLKGLSGTLSPRIGDLPNLQYLNLWGNSLSGNLPISLGNIKNMIAFRLSDNKFSGKIPTSLSQLSMLRILDLTNNQLSGPVPTSGVFSKFGYNSFKGNPGLCGGVVRKTCPRKMK